MNCEELRKYLTDYMAATLGAELTEGVETHLLACTGCSRLLSELENTSSLVRSLDRVAVPAGFDRRLRERLTSQRAGRRGWSILNRALRVLAEAFIGGPAARRTVLRPVIAGLVLCTLVGASLFMLLGTDNLAQATDQAFIETCQKQHTSFAAANPLADDSAVLLKERASDLADEL